jgi:Protein of unknown function (DUF2911)
MRTIFASRVLVLLFAASVASLATVASAQPKASPPGTAEVTLKGKKFSIAYSRPSVKGRKIMGELVPYGKVWRTGANAATSLTTETDLTIGGLKVPAGSYTLYTLPGVTDWKLIVNKKTGQWGTEYDEGSDLGRVDLKKSATEKPVEQFTVSFAKKGDDAADLVLEWENTRLVAGVKAQ